MDEWLEVYTVIQIIGVLSAIWFVIDEKQHNYFCFFIKCSLAAFESKKVNLLGKIIIPIVDLLLLPSSIIVFTVGLLVLGVVRLFTTKEGFKNLID